MDKYIESFSLSTRDDGMFRVLNILAQFSDNIFSIFFLLFLQAVSYIIDRDFSGHKWCFIARFCHDYLHLTPSFSTTAQRKRVHIDAF